MTKARGRIDTPLTPARRRVLAELARAIEVRARDSYPAVAFEGDLSGEVAKAVANRLARRGYYTYKFKCGSGGPPIDYGYKLPSGSVRLLTTLAGPGPDGDWPLAVAQGRWPDDATVPKWLLAYPPGIRLYYGINLTRPEMGEPITMRIVLVRTTDAEPPSSGGADIVVNFHDPLEPAIIG